MRLPWPALTWLRPRAVAAAPAPVSVPASASGPHDLAAAPVGAETLRVLRALGWASVLLPVLAYAAVGVYRYQQITAETELRLDRALRVAQEHALKVLDTNETLIGRVTDALGRAPASVLQQREPALHEQLRAISRSRPQIHSIWVTDAQGRVVASDRASPPPPLDFAANSGFRAHQALQALYISGRQEQGLPGGAFIDMSAGRRNARGEFLGMVSVPLSSAYFEQFHRDLAADEPGLAITMFREDGTVLTRWPPLATAPPRLAESSPVLSRVRAGIPGGPAHGVSSLDGRRRLLFYRKIGEYPVYMGTGMSVAEIQRRWAQEMAWLAAFGLPPLLGLLFVARMALRRTRDALEAARRLQEETQARRRVEEALVQAQKLEALGRLTGGVAHDFNNALMVISNNVLLVKLRHPEVASPQLASIERAIGSATKLTRQLLAFSRRQALVPQVLRLQDRLPATRELLAPVVGSRIALRVDVAPQTPAIVVDPAEFELALINLAINARDAMPAGGELALVARPAVGEELPSLLPPAPMVLVEVRDSGTGIPPEILDKVFEPFFTTKAVGEGTGLGLSQVYGLCQRAGGTAAIESAPGRGTAIRMFFPPADGQPAPPAAGGPALARDLGLRVLLVEDNDEVAGALRQVLQTLGCEVTRLDRARSARDWLDARTPATLPDVLLTDVVMPGEMDGLALAQHVREQHPGLRVLLMTGYAQHLEAISAQGFEVLPKPCAADVLVAALQRQREGGAAILDA